jgi:hypothetical protein
MDSFHHDYHDHKPNPQQIQALPKGRHLGEDVRKPPRYAGRSTLSIWRLQLWFECTFGLTVMEPWERMVVRKFSPSLISVPRSHFISDILRDRLVARVHRSRSVLPPEDRRFAAKDDVLLMGSCRRDSSFVIIHYDIWMVRFSVQQGLRVSSCVHTHPQVITDLVSWVSALSR